MGDSKKYYAGHIKQEEVSEVKVLTGAFMLVKRSVYLKVGGFDEDYFMFGEDIDLSYKLLNQGLQNYYFGRSTIIHYKGESTIKDETYLKNFYGAMEIFYKKHFTTSFANKWILKNALKAFVLFKSKKVIENKILISKTNTLLLLSSDPDKYERLKQKLDPIKVERSLEMPKDLSPYGKIIFDNSLFTFKEIIQNFELFKGGYVSLRIIPNNTFFFIGSDSSKERGEVFKF
jgi:GT2 family glycosyltransferase